MAAGAPNGGAKKEGGGPRAVEHTARHGAARCCLEVWAVEVSVTRCESKAGMAVVTVCGEIDSPAADVLDEHVRRLIEGDVVFLIFDLTETTYINSAGLGVLAMAAKQARARGGDVALAGLRDRPRRAVEMVRLDLMVITAGDVNAAKERLISSSPPQC